MTKYRFNWKLGAAIAVAIGLAILAQVRNVRTNRLAQGSQTSHIAPPRTPAEDSPAGAPSLPPSDLRLLAAIRRVESGGNDIAVGDGGKSRGPYQIGRLYWADGTEYGGVDWDYDKYVYDPGRCVQVMRWYWARYGAQTDEHKARIHNGGPRGHRKAATRGYWVKVRAAMDP